MKQPDEMKRNAIDDNKNTFVFVVCGSAEHIHTLHFSLHYLMHFSQLSVIVVTDSRRNEIPVEHNSIIDIATPPEMSHHQASIWLKTSLHRLLPEGPVYCYLDSDVIALNTHCDDIFEHYIPPVTFAPDHCTTSWFSPYAVNCDCSRKAQEEREETERAIATAVQHPAYPPDWHKPFTRKVFALLSQMASNPLAHIGAFFRILMAYITGKSRISGDINLNIRKKQWESGSDSYPFLFAYRKQIRKQSGYRLAMAKRTWQKPNGSIPLQNRCTHLHEKIAAKFGVTVPGKDWQHWNGGVFLFDKNSANFMDEWHRKTMDVFADSEWKVRDQGTLIATVVSQKLTSHSTLPEEYNFIADFYKPGITSSQKQPGIFNTGTRRIRPAFIHVYHHFGDTEWEVWRHIESFSPQQKQKEENR